MRKTDVSGFVQIVSCVEYLCIFGKFMNDAGCEIACLVELRW